MLAAPTSIEYNTDKLPCQIHLPGRPVITLSWSPIGQLLRLQQGAAVTEYTYDPHTDALQYICDPNGLITEFVRNDYQQIITLRQYPKSQPQVVREHHFTHKNGRLIDKTDPLGRKTRYRHSNFSQVSQQTNADGGLLSYQRDRERNLIGIQRDRQTESYNMVYDLVENRIETIGFDKRAQQYGFDVDNRLQSVMDADERSIKVERDRKGNILQQSAQHNGQTHNNGFTWDKTDKLTQADNAQRNINIQHHANGLPESIEQGEWRIAKQYDDAARTIELWLPDGDVIGFDFDDQGLSQISRNEKPLLIFHRDASGREILCEQANGVELQQGWYPFGELAAQQWLQVNEEAKHTRAYYFNQQQLIKIGDSEQGDTEYAYDAIDQLLQVTGPHPEKFGWDAFGNPQGDDIGVFQDRLGIKGQKRYQHDGSGNQIAVEVESSESGLYEPIEHREFNGFNQLTRFSDEKNASTYEYDALFRRSAKINQHGRVDFLWDGPYLIGEVRDGLFTWWIYEPDTFRPLLMIQNGKVYYYHTDHLGTPLKLTDENAEVVWAATYSAFGKATILVEKVKQPLRFPGQYYDAESGLCSNGFRYYDPELGRYITQDPIGLAGGLNPYQYAPNPVMWIDPTGLICKEGLKKQLTEQFQWLGAADVDSFIADLLSEQGIPYARVAGQTRINAVAKSNIGADDQLTNINDQLMVIATTASGATTEVPLKELVRQWTVQNSSNKASFSSTSATTNNTSAVTAQQTAAQASEPIDQRVKQIENFIVLLNHAESLRSVGDSIRTDDAYFQNAIADIRSHGYDSEFARISGLGLRHVDDPNALADIALNNREGFANAIIDKSAFAGAIGAKGLNNLAVPGVPEITHPSLADVDAETLDYFADPDAFEGISRDTWKTLHAAGFTDYKTFELLGQTGFNRQAARVEIGMAVATLGVTLLRNPQALAGAAKTGLQFGARQIGVLTALAKGKLNSVSTVIDRRVTQYQLQRQLNQSLKNVDSKVLDSIIKVPVTRKVEAPKGVEPKMLAKDIKDGIVRNGVYPRNELTFNLRDRIGSNGQILELNSTKGVHGERMFLIDKYGNVFIGKRSPNGDTRMPHPTLIGGKNPEVLSAGMIQFSKGRILSVSNPSGHFMPKATTLNTAEKILRNLLPRDSFSRKFKGFNPAEGSF